MKEKTADELFDDLGLWLERETPFDFEVKNDDDKVIKFNKERREIACFNYYDGFEYLTLQELQAIIKKCQELGVDIMMTPGDIDKLQKECDFEHMKETIDKQQTQIRELIDKNKVVDLDYKEEYYNLQKENYKLKKKIEAYQEALLNICSK